MAETTRKNADGFVLPLPDAGSQPAPAVLTVAGYELLEELGRGGMGAVYRAREPGGREVALKVLLALDDPELIERFKLEARATARLKHPNVVVVHDMGWEGGRPYLVMQLVRGDSLKTILKRSGPLPSRRAAELTLQLAEGIVHAHESGVVHRDLTPGNVMVDEEGRALLTDFGLARLLGSSLRLTQTGTSMGTPSYMSPEQAQGQPGDERVDVYGLGGTLYHLLCGQPPYPGDSPMLVMDAVANSPLEAPSRIQPGIDPRLEAICLRCLEKQPRDRYTTAFAVAEALRAYLGSTPEPAAQTGIGGLVAVVVVVLALSAGAVLSVSLRGPTQPNSPAQPPAQPAQLPAPPTQSPPPVDPAAGLTPEPAPLPSEQDAAVALVDRELDHLAAQLDGGGITVAGALERVDGLLVEAPFYGRLYFARARLKLRSKAREEALADLRQADQVQVPYTESDLYQQRGSLLCAARKYEEAYPDLRRACADRPKDGQLAFMLGFACRDTRRFEEAERELRRSEALRPDDWTAPFNLAGVYGTLGRFEEAIAAYERSHQAARGRAHWPLVRMCDSLLKLDRFEEAEACLERLLREVPAARKAGVASVIESQFSRVYLKQGRIEEAQAYAERALDRDFNDRTATGVAAVYEMLGRKQEAIALLEKAEAQGIDSDLLRGALRRLREEE